MYRVDAFAPEQYVSRDQDIALRAVNDGKSAPTDDGGLRAWRRCAHGVSAGAFTVGEGGGGKFTRISPVRYRPPGPAFDFAQQRLDISIPRAAWLPSARPYPRNTGMKVLTRCIELHLYRRGMVRIRPGGSANSYFLG